MTPEQQAALDATAQERAASLHPEKQPITLQSIHDRLVAVENHPALNQKEEHPNG
jgi:hypothetical protein